jgi:predicted ABC-type ATPase
VRRLDLVVGPNGAGKSTFVAKTLARALPPGVPFVNADVIAHQRWPGAEQEHAYDAAAVAAQTRAAMIEGGHTFIAETVFSHPGKLALIDDAHARGFTVALHVLLVPEELSVARVEHRVRAGGHAVPEHKIRERHRRLWPLVVTAAMRADTAVFYDNATLAGPRIVAQLAAGTPVGSLRWPQWTSPDVVQAWSDVTSSP